MPVSRYGNRFLIFRCSDLPITRLPDLPILLPLLQFLTRALSDRPHFFTSATATTFRRPHLYPLTNPPLKENPNARTRDHCISLFVPATA
jgi:hypothetical protein